MKHKKKKQQQLQQNISNNTSNHNNNASNNTINNTSRNTSNNTSKNTSNTSNNSYDLGVDVVTPHWYPVVVLSPPVDKEYLSISLFLRPLYVQEKSNAILEETCETEAANVYTNQRHKKTQHGMQDHRKGQ